MGIFHNAPASDLPLTTLSEVMAANVEAGLHLSQLAYPLMKANGKGSIVFNSSIVALSAAGFQCSVYSISKGNKRTLGHSLFNASTIILPSLGMKRLCSVFEIASSTALSIM